MMKSYFTRLSLILFFSDIRIKKILNKEKIKHFILKGSRLDNETFYKDIYRLRRSSYIQYRNNLVIRKYFEFQNEPTIEKNSNQEYAEEFFHLFKKNYISSDGNK